MLYFCEMPLVTNCATPLLKGAIYNRVGYKNTGMDREPSLAMLRKIWSFEWDRKHR